MESIEVLRRRCTAARLDWLLYYLRLEFEMPKIRTDSQLVSSLLLLLVIVSVSGCGDQVPTQGEPTSASPVATSTTASADSTDADADSTDTGSTDSNSADAATIGSTDTAEPDKSDKGLFEPGTVAVAPHNKSVAVAPHNKSDGVPERNPVASEAKPEPTGTRLPDDLLEGETLTPLNKQGTVLLDLSKKRIFLKSNVCFREGLLEMFLCRTQTKEHESILVMDAEAYAVHTGLLALGCEEGSPATYDQEGQKYTPAKGQVIDIFVHSVDENGKLNREPAQSWIRRSRYRYYEEKFEWLPADLTLNPDSNLRYDTMNKVIFWYGPMTNAQRDDCLKMSADQKFKAAIERFYDESQAR